MEPIIAMLLTVALACAIGFRKGGNETLNDADTKALCTTYREYLRAVSAAGLVRLSNFVGDFPEQEDMDEAVKGPRLIADMVAVLEGEKANMVIRGVHADENPTVESFLAGIADDAERYWPGEITTIHRVCGSLT